MRGLIVRGATVTCGIVAALAAVLATAPASSATGAVLTTGGTGGTAVPAGGRIHGSLAPGTKLRFSSSATGGTGITCTSSNFSGTLTDNPPAPGAAAGTIDTLGIGGCTSNSVGVSGVNSVNVAVPFPFTVSSAGTVTAGDPIDVTLVLNTVLGPASCLYTGTVDGTVSNTGNSVTFTDQHFTRTSGSSLCFADSYFSAEYAPVTDASGNPVYLN
jgi:hypothetical protein